MHKSTLPDRARGGLRALEPRLGRPLVAARAGREGVPRGGQRPRGAGRQRLGLRRGPLDAGRRDRPRRPDAGDRGRAVRALLLAQGGRVHAQGARRPAQPVRRPRGRARRRGGLLDVPASIPTDAPREQVGDNPLVEGLERLPVAPTTMVIFGASGDLAARKLLPALYNLAHEGALPERFNLIGAARREQTDDEFRDGRARVDPQQLAARARRAGARRPARAHALRVGPVRRRRGLRQARQEDRGARRGRRPAAGAHVLPVDRARVLPGDRRAAQGGRPAPPQRGGRPRS